MRVSRIQVSNFRSLANASLEPGAVNVLVGANNAGKSSVIRALYQMQAGGGQPFADVRTGSSASSIEISLVDTTDFKPLASYGQLPSIDLRIDISARSRDAGDVTRYLTLPGNGRAQFDEIRNVEPHHFIVPFLSKRKTGAYQEDVRQQFANAVEPNMSYLAAKLLRVVDPGFPGSESYRNACASILGFVVSAVSSNNGARPGIYLPDRTELFIDQMGEGVPNIVALLVELTLSRGKLFLIEEPENDLHPAALKSLLNLIGESAQHNQFVVSTHSNVVVRHLGSLDSVRLFNVVAKTGTLPTESEVLPVEPTASARLAVLRDLGYTLSDFDLWDGWLILEESSAERIIRDYLIPWFVPRLSRIRTLATNGVTNVEPTFEDFYRLVRFAHLEEAYQNAAWVRVDGDGPGQDIIARLRQKFPSWKSSRFNCFSESQFERYYPVEFTAEVETVLSLTSKQDRRAAKRQLLDKVRAWLDEDDARGRQALLASASEVVEELKAIDRQLFSTKAIEQSH